MLPRRPEKIIQNIRINIFVNHFKTVSKLFMSFLRIATIFYIFVISSGMVTIILYLLCIIASLVMVRFSQMPKKRDYLSLAFDLTIMILLFTWDKEHLVAFISLSLVLVTVFVVLFYFTIIKPAKCANYLDYFRQQEQKDRLKLYLTVMLIIPAIVIKSRVVMFFFLLAYILVERFLFYKKHHSLA